LNTRRAPVIESVKIDKNPVFCELSKLQGERKPKCLIFLNPLGNTWSRNLRINSVASSVISFMALFCARSFQVKTTFPFSKNLMR